jgi:hypothetical protein
MKEEKEKLSITSKHIFLGSILVLLIYIAFGYFTHHLSFEDRGSFGDMFGAVNALFSGFALFGIILSIYIQRQELGTQKEELKLTRAEFKQNRLTNILFRKIESFNKDVTEANFSDYGYLGQHTYEKKLNMTDFQNKIIYENAENRNKEIFNINDKILSRNSKVILKLSSQLARDIYAVQKLVYNSNLEKDAQDELLYIYAHSINSDFIDFIIKFVPISKRFLKITNTSIFSDVQEIKASGHFTMTIYNFFRSKTVNFEEEHLAS